ncbi:MAG TPA: hypothetical protein VEL74_10115 [Thermoanaerobaculia bacterium]|nr:hypothetical protein [Thermoanaerobaculia bacterium]
MKMRTLLLVSLIILFTAGAALAQGSNMDCSCTAAGCGNGGVGGDQGDIFINVPPAEVKQYFGPNTGWTCVVPSLVRGSGGPLGCFCAGYCGNGGIGADPNTFDLGLSQDTINSSYGGGKPGNKTGWLCGDYRGSWNAAEHAPKKQ